MGLIKMGFTVVSKGGTKEAACPRRRENQKSRVFSILALALVADKGS